MNLNALDLNLVRVLDALLKERSVTRAGERIGLSQPAVSAALNRLRAVLDDKLFIRNGHAMVPTPRAESLAEPVRIALKAIERAFETGGGFDPRTLERTYTLFGADFFSTLLLPQLAVRLMQTAPLTKLRLLDNSRGRVDRLLQDGTIDVALEPVTELPEWALNAHLFLSPFVVIAAADNSQLKRLQLAAGDVIPLQTFCKLWHAIRSADGSMSGIADQALKGAGVQRRVAVALPHFYAVARTVAASDLVAAFPCQLADAVAKELRLAIYRPPVPIPVPDIRMYWHARYEDDAQHRLMRALILSVSEELGFGETARRYSERPA